MKVGAEPKKVAILGGLAVLAGYLLYTNVLSGPTGSAVPSRPVEVQSTAPAAGLRAPARALPRPENHPSSRAGLREFRPSLKPRQEDQRPDLTSIDANLRLDLLARLQEVTVEGGERSLFEFAPAPLPKKPEPKIIPEDASKTTNEPGENKKPEAKKPPPPRIPLKFYGYVTQARRGAKRAFFLDGEDILVASEGDVVKKRYKVVRIGVNSVVVEDLEHKNEQTLPLEAEAQVG